MTAPQSQAVSARANRWHQSTLSNLLDGCSWQYFLTYIVGLSTGKKPHAAIGTAYHSAIELHENNRIKNLSTSEKEMQDYANKLFQKSINDSDPEYDELSTNLRDAISNWYEYHRPVVLEWTPVAIEPEFTLPLVDEHKPIGGYIDAIYRDADGKLFIVDHKTAKNFDRWRDADGHRTQAAMYATALVLSEDFPEITELPEMVYMVTRTSTSTRSNFEKGKVLRVQPTLEDVRLLGDRVRAAENMVKTESYKTKTDWPLCSQKWCAFYQGCQVDKTLSGTPDGVRLRVQLLQIK
jgi:RecB family exonuclease